MKIDGVPKFLKDPIFHEAWKVALQDAPSRIEKEEMLQGKSKLELFVGRFRRWAEMALESSHDGTLPHNFSIVDDLEGIYRGGFPKPEHLSRFKELGITRVISLCDLDFHREQKYMDSLEPSLKDSGIEQEQCLLTREMVKNNQEVVALAQKIFIRLEQRGLLGDKKSLFMTPKQLYRGLGIIPEEKVYIHCENGVERTGKIVLALRMMAMADSYNLSDEYQKFSAPGYLKFKFDVQGDFYKEAMDLWHLCNISVAESKGEEIEVRFWREMYKIHKRMMDALEYSFKGGDKFRTAA